MVLEALHPLPEIDSGMLMMTLWRVWHNHNEVTHKKGSIVDGSVQAFPDELHGLALITEIL